MEQIKEIETTNTANVRDWLEVSKNLEILAYIDYDAAVLLDDEGQPPSGQDSKQKA